MFIIVQIPFVDLRLIHSTVDEAYFFPHMFPDKMNNSAAKKKKEDINQYRYMGHKHCRKAPIGMELSETTFYSDNRLIKIATDYKQKYKIIFTRLFADKMFFHFDIGIIVETCNAKEKETLNKILYELFNKPVLNVRQVKHCADMSGRKLKLNIDKEYNVISIQQYIRDLYLYGTTKVKSNYCADKHQLVPFGKPTVLCEASEKEVIWNSKEYIKIQNVSDISILMKTYIIRDTSCAVDIWISEKSEFSNSDKDMRRKFRISLLKYNCYLQGFRKIFEYIDNSAFEYQNFSKFFVNTLKEFSKKLSRDRCNGFDTKKDCDQALEMSLEIEPIIWNDYKEKIDIYIEEYEELRKMKNSVGNIIFSGPVIEPIITNNGDNCTTTIVHNNGNDKILHELDVLKQELSENYSENLDGLLEEVQNIKMIISQNGSLENKEKITTWKKIRSLSEKIGCSALAKLIADSIINLV